LHAGGQYEWDSAAPVVVARAAGLHTSRIDGSPLVYNQPDPLLPDLVVCRPEFADAGTRRHRRLTPHSTLWRMSNPTLRVLADLPQQPVSLSESTLILIDCQNTYTRGGDGTRWRARKPSTRPPCCSTGPRSAGIPIIHIQHDDGPDSLYDIEGESGAIVPRVAPQNGEPVVVKNYPNSFVQTDLDEVLKTANASNLLLVGFMTHMCVNSTARGACNLGYSPTVVASATATRALPGVVTPRCPQKKTMQAASLAADGRPVRCRGAGRVGYPGLIRLAEFAHANVGQAEYAVRGHGGSWPPSTTVVLVTTDDLAKAQGIPPQVPRRHPDGSAQRPSGAQPPRPRRRLCAGPPRRRHQHRRRAALHRRSAGQCARHRPR